MRKLLTMLSLVILPVMAFAEENNSSSHLQDVSIKENLINELLVDLVNKKEEHSNIEIKKHSQPKEDAQVTETTYQTGKASFYGERWNGRKTANGEIFNTEKVTAAHKTLPFGTKVKVTNVSNGKSIIVRINDRGPYIKGRIIDLSKAAFRQLEDINKGVIKVKLDILEN